MGTATQVRVEFAEETAEGVWDESIELVSANHEETGVVDGATFAPDRDKYIALNELGTFRVFTARLRGRLVGYSVFMVHESLIYPGETWAVQDVIYVHPEHRGRTAVRFIRTVDKSLHEDLGVKAILRHVSRKLDFGRTLERLGYHEQEVSYLRRF
jgi:GNAT superfamily N-acetyltransferase